MNAPSPAYIRTCLMEAQRHAWRIVNESGDHTDAGHLARMIASELAVALVELDRLEMPEPWKEPKK